MIDYVSIKKHKTKLHSDSISLFSPVFPSYQLVALSNFHNLSSNSVIIGETCSLSSSPWILCLFYTPTLFILINLQALSTLYTLTAPTFISLDMNFYPELNIKLPLKVQKKSIKLPLLEYKVGISNLKFLK